MKKLLLSLSLAICLSIGSTLSLGNIAMADTTYTIQGSKDPEHVYKLSVSAPAPTPGTTITVYKPIPAPDMNLSETTFYFSFYEVDSAGNWIESTAVNHTIEPGAYDSFPESIQITIQNNISNLELVWSYDTPDLKDSYCFFWWDKSGQMSVKDAKSRDPEPFTGKGTTTTNKPAATKPASTPEPVKLTSNPFTPGPEGTIYRLLLPTTNKHLYSTDVNECKSLTAAGWVQETSPGISATSGVGIYRLYNPATDEHLFTADTNERDTLASKNGWKIDNGGNPVYYLK